MINEVHIEIASAAFLALLFFTDLFKRQLPVKKVITFQILLCVMMLCSFSTVDYILTMRYSTSVLLNTTIYTCTMIIGLFCVMATHWHVMSLIYRLDRKTLRGKIDLCIFGIMILIIALSPWTHWYYTISLQGQYHKTIIAYLMIAVLCIYLITDLIYLWYRAREYSLRRKLMCSCMLVCFLTVAFRDVSNSQSYIFYNVFVVLFLYVYYLSLQSPDFYVDNVTGSFNRNGFEESLYERIAYHVPTACFMVRVRNFGAMASVYGDEVLLKVQKLILELIEKKCHADVIFHVGSSSFAILLDTKEQVEELYDYLKENLLKVWIINDEIINHEYSFYQVLYPEDEIGFDEIMQRIHYARSDHEGHHKPGELIHLGKTAIQDITRAKEVAHLVEEAIMDNSIEINLQPIYSFSRNMITSVEVLARLKDREKNYINPEYFIHIAEENHSIIALGEQIFRKACIFASQYHIFDYGIEEMNINLSPVQCRYDNLIERFVEIAKEYDIPMNHIHLEITESEFTDKEAVDRTLQRFSEKGVKVALDDFGTGFSTIANILELPVDYVKIDKSLVWSYATGKNQFLNDMMPMIKAEGKKIIAEGIESEEQMDIIRKLNGDYLQGYYFSKPLKESEFVRYIKKYNGFR